MDLYQHHLVVKMRREIMKWKSGLLTLAAATFLLGTSPIIAQPIARGSSAKSLPTIELPNGATVPDFKRITLDSFPAINGSGSFEIPGLGTVSFKPGDKATDVLTLGSIKELGADKLDLGTISKLTGIDLGNKTLADFPLLKTQSVSDLVKAIPDLGNLPIGEVKPILDLVKGDTGSFAVLNKLGFDTPISQALQQIPGLQNLSLGNLNLNAYSLLSLDGIKEAALGKFQGALSAQIGKFLGLDKIALGNFPIPITFAGGVGTVDVVYGEKETNRTNTITGSYEEGFNVPCKKPCSYIELSGNPLAHGKQWISGKSQKLRNGEPTGRFPYGPAFKVVMTDANESTGTAEFGAYTRFCAFGICTPYIIGPFPLPSVKEKGTIILGL
jgi:hypothetical protein